MFIFCLAESGGLPFCLQNMVALLTGQNGIISFPYLSVHQEQLSRTHRSTFYTIASALCSKESQLLIHNHSVFEFCINTVRYLCKQILQILSFHTSQLTFMIEKINVVANAKDFVKKCNTLIDSLRHVVRFIRVGSSSGTECPKYMRYVLSELLL